MSAGAGPAAVRLRAAFVATAAVGGAVLGVLVALAGAVLGSVIPDATARRLLAVAVLVLLFVRQRQLGELRRWGLNMVVPSSMVNVIGARTGVVWGLALGSGVVTQVPNATIPAYLVAGALLMPDPVLLVATGVLFGVARAMPGVVGPVREALVASVERGLATASGREVAAGLHLSRLLSQLVLLVCIVVLALRAVAGWP